MTNAGRLARFQAWLAALWAGSTVALGGLAAPALFSALERQVAGVGAGRIFQIEANLSLFMAMLMFVMERRRVRDAIESGASASAMSPALIMILAVLFITIVGQHVLHPMIQSARLGTPGLLSFGILHGMSAALYWVKAAVLVALSWRLMGAIAHGSHQTG